MIYKAIRYTFVFLIFQVVVSVLLRAQEFVQTSGAFDQMAIDRCMQFQDWSSALHIINRELDKTPEDLNLLCQKALVLKRQKEPEKSLDIYKSVLAKAPLRSEALVGMAFDYAQKGNLEKAIVYLQKAREQATEKDKHFWVSYVQFMTEFCQEYDTIKYLQPFFQRILLQQQISDCDDSSILEITANTFIYYKQYDLLNSIADLAIKTKPELGSSYIYGAYAALLNNRSDKTVLAYMEKAQQASNAPFIQKSIFCAYIDYARLREQYEEGYVYSSRLLKIDPTDTVVTLYKILFASLLQKHDEAINLLTQLEKDGQAQPVHNIDLAAVKIQILANAGKWRAALDVLDNNQELLEKYKKAALWIRLCCTAQLDESESQTSKLFKEYMLEDSKNFYIKNTLQQLK